MTRRILQMKPEYSFKGGKRGAVGKEPALEAKKSRITIRLDTAILDRFFEMADATGGAVGYQTLINKALSEYLEAQAPANEELLRRVIREEIAHAGRGVRPSAAEKARAVPTSQKKKSAKSTPWRKGPMLASR